ncbi:hypothetical protein ACOMHN_058186 [Nucella lapillus]
MESVEKDCSVLGILFQTIINDLRNSSPIWEDFSYKATKLHQCLKTTLGAISSFLEAFQKIADMATNSRGATKEIGSALTRLCMRHRSIETCLKSLTNSVLDSVVVPLQEHLEEWKKVVAQLDKDHAKEYKKARQEIKKAASDTMRLQKKVNKGKNEMQKKLEGSMREVNDKYLLLGEMEKSSIRTALIEERTRFCIFISCMKPFVDQEVHLLSEVTHLQDIMHSLCMQASDPDNLPPSSEQVITDLKGIDISTLTLQGKQHPSPPSSPSSLGSRKSSVCSMASINSCSSTSSKSHSPGHTLHKHNTLQLPLGVERLTSVSSQDSGFTSQDTLFVRSTTPLSLSLHQDTCQNSTDTQDSSSTPGSPCADLDATLTPSAFSAHSLPFGPSASRLDRARPHTISAASEKAFARLPLKPELFEPLPEGEGEGRGQEGGKGRSQSMSVDSPYMRPAAAITKMQPILPPHCPKPRVKAVPPPALPPEMQPAYANTAELHQMALERRHRERQQSVDSANSAVTTIPPQQNPPQSAPNAPNAPDSSARDALELEEAIRSLDSVTAALGAELAAGKAAVVVKEDDREEKGKEGESCEARRSTRSQKASQGLISMQQQNSLELAEAIRELEQSTAALHSTYDADSHGSAQGSSGYTTMDSTPSSSDDVIPPGGSAAPSVSAGRSVSHDSEKYFTLPRSGGMTAALRSALFPARTSSGGSLHRRGSMNTPKPPPPVRRTPAISQAAVRPPRPSQHGESFYAELHTVQQSIQEQRLSQQQQQPPVYSQQAPPAACSQQQPVVYCQQPPVVYCQQPPAVYSKPGQLQRQDHVEYVHQQPPANLASPSPDRASVSSGGTTDHYAVPIIPGTAQMMQSLNAKLSSLNQQYGDPQYQRTGTYVGGGVDVDPGAAGKMPPPAHQGSTQYSHTHPAPRHGGRDDPPPPPPPDEDFPQPPTEQELAEMETVYAKPPPVNPKPKVTGDLMMELKRRMSTDEYSNV